MPLRHLVLMKELERMGKSEESCMKPLSPLRQKPQPP